MVPCIAQTATMASTFGDGTMSKVWVVARTTVGGLEILVPAGIQDGGSPGHLGGVAGRQSTMQGNVASGN